MSRSKNIYALLNQLAPDAAIVFIRRIARSAPSIHLPCRPAISFRAPQECWARPSGNPWPPVTPLFFNSSARPPPCPASSSGTPPPARPFLTLRALEGLTAAIHLSGVNLAAHRWTPDFKREILESRVASTRTLATALAALRHPPQALLVASATGIYGNRGQELLDETSPPGDGFLADACRQWEAAAQPAVDAGIRVIHLRFGVVLGPGPGTLGKLLPILPPRPRRTPRLRHIST